MPPSPPQCIYELLMDLTLYINMYSESVFSKKPQRCTILPLLSQRYFFIFKYMLHIYWLLNSARRMACDKFHNTHLILVLDGAGCIPEPRVISSFSISSALMRQTTNTQSSRFLQKKRQVFAF